MLKTQAQVRQELKLEQEKMVKDIKKMQEKIHENIVPHAEKKVKEAEVHDVNQGGAMKLALAREFRVIENQTFVVHKVLADDSLNKLSLMYQISR